MSWRRYALQDKVPPPPTETVSTRKTWTWERRCLGLSRPPPVVYQVGARNKDVDLYIRARVIMYLLLLACLAELVQGRGVGYIFEVFRVWYIHQYILRSM